MKVYKWVQWVLALALVPAAAATDESALAITIRAQTDFDRVGATAFPSVADTARCAQSQAVLLPLVLPSEQPLARFRKGWCELLGAALADSRAGYRQAAAEFAQAMAGWPARSPEPIPAPMRILSGVARLQAGAEQHVWDDIRAGFQTALFRPSCPEALLTPRRCQEVTSLGQVWLGWMALTQGDLGEAARNFRDFPELGWASWVAGQQALRTRRSGDAARELSAAVESWIAARKYPRPGVLRQLAPKPDIPEALAQLGEARYMAGNSVGALQSLDAAIKERPSNARAIFTRGLARDALGQAEAALQDYQLASRTAFAHPDVPSAAAEAHMYRGVWHFRRQDWERAEDEFSRALNAGPGPALRADIAAWRHLAAVAGGACLASASELGRALAGVSGLFPIPEAELRIRACTRRTATISSRE